MNELHLAARYGSTERTVAVLSRGVVDIDEGTPEGYTALAIASFEGYSRVVRILLNKGANIAISDRDGFTALHWSVQEGLPSVTKLLLKVGADLEATTSNLGATPLHMAAERGHSEVLGLLIEAGVNPNSRELDGSTPLYSAARGGHVDAVKVLLRAGADPLLTRSSPSEKPFLPLDAAATHGHLEVARELIQAHGIEGCGGASGGVEALRLAARKQRMEIMGMLTSAGVVDTGVALRAAATCGRESSVKFLLQQQEWKASGDDGAPYLNTSDPSGATPLVRGILACYSCSPRITRLLVDAGADTTTAVRVNIRRVVFADTPLALADFVLSENNIGGKDATESQLHSLEATRRLLLKVEAVHAVSWLWTSDVPSITQAAAEGPGRATKATSTPLTSMLPILRRRARRSRVLLAALFRHSGKPN